MTSRSRNVSLRRRVLPASDTSIADGCDRRASTTSRTTGNPLPRSPRRGSAGPAPSASALRIFVLGRCTKTRQRPDPLALCRLLQLGKRRDAELPPDPCGRLRAEARQAHERSDLARHLGPALCERRHLSGLRDLDDLRLDRLPDVRQLLGLTLKGQLRHGRRRIADAGGSASVGSDPERLLAEDLREIRELVELVGQIGVARERRDHRPIIGARPKA